MTKATKFEITPTYILVPMCVMAMTLVFFFAFQAIQVMKEKDGLNNSNTQLATTFEQSQKVNSQFGGLVLGTQKLAKEGTKTAKELVTQLVKIGILPDPAKAPGVAPVPAAMTKAKGPVKP